MKWWLWAPIQDNETREICMHMTTEEKSAAVLRGLGYGIWCGITGALPSVGLVDGIIFGNASRVTMGVCMTLILIHLICIPFWLRYQRKVLRSTIWAQEHSKQDK
ncbi:MAG: hypothetical protein QG656_1975 [Candidatus Hydrogenedentes bacterium]|nr:hypothetical protein [Candidatus Hydrogenedentota bacterium]